MFEVSLVIVPPGGGEADYSLRMRLPALPRAGDYIGVLRTGMKDKGEDYLGSEDFIVRRVWWTLEYPDDGHALHRVGEDPVGSTSAIMIECEYAIGHYSSKAHKDAAGTNAQKWEASAY